MGGEMSQTQDYMQVIILNNKRLYMHEHNLEYRLLKPDFISHIHRLRIFIGQIP